MTDPILPWVVFLFLIRINELLVLKFVQQTGYTGFRFAIKFLLLSNEIQQQQKKNHLFRWSSFWSWRVCKQEKLSRLGHQKPARLNWKADVPKTSYCLVRILVQRLNWAIFSSKMSKERPLQSMAIVMGPCWTNFCSQKLKRRILATFGFNRTALRAKQPKLHSMFCALFLKIALSAAELM